MGLEPTHRRNGYWQISNLLPYQLGLTRQNYFRESNYVYIPQMRHSASAIASKLFHIAFKIFLNIFTFLLFFKTLPYWANCEDRIRTCMPQRAVDFKSNSLLLFVVSYKTMFVRFHCVFPFRHLASINTNKEVEKQANYFA